MTHNEKDDKRFQQSSQGRDLDSTIQFTDDELRRIRNYYNQRIHQPRSMDPEAFSQDNSVSEDYDQDYFDRDQMSEENQSLGKDKLSSDYSGYEEDYHSRFDHQTSYSEADDQWSDADLPYPENRHSSKKKHSMGDELSFDEETEENPFVYVSQRDRIREEFEREADQGLDYTQPLKHLTRSLKGLWKHREQDLDRPDYDKEASSYFEEDTYSPDQDRLYSEERAWSEDFDTDYAERYGDRAQAEEDFEDLYYNQDYASDDYLEADQSHQSSKEGPQGPSIWQRLKASTQNLVDQVTSRHDGDGEDDWAEDAYQDDYESEFLYPEDSVNDQEIQPGDESLNEMDFEEVAFDDLTDQADAYDLEGQTYEENLVSSSSLPNENLEEDKPSSERPFLEKKDDWIQREDDQNSLRLDDEEAGPYPQEESVQVTEEDWADTSDQEFDINQETDSKISPDSEQVGQVSSEDGHVDLSALSASVLPTSNQAVEAEPEKDEAVSAEDHDLIQAGQEMNSLSEESPIHVNEDLDQESNLTEDGQEEDYEGLQVGPGEVDDQDLQASGDIVFDATLNEAGGIDAILRAEEEDYHRRQSEDQWPDPSHQASDQSDYPLEEDQLGDQSANFVSGAIWMTLGSIFSRILGAIYIIPWAAWLGAEYTQANTLYSVGYKPYSLFLAIATAGFPSAIAKLIAHYHSKHEYQAAQKIFRYSLIVMLATGLVSGGILFALAPVLAAQSPTINPEGATFVIRSLVPALLILPVMSLFRGYFQGFNDMKPTAISQIIEQVARVAYLLAATYAIMKVYSGDVTQAVVHSTFAAFIGALLSFVYLGILYARYIPKIKGLLATSKDRVVIDFATSFKLMIRDSIPFVLLGSGIIIAQLIDTYTFSQIMQATSPLLLVEISELYGTLSLDVDKLMMIIISLAVAMATSAVPAVTSLYAKGDVRATSHLVQRILTIFLFVMLPASFGMMAIADNVYHLFYAEGSPSGPALLMTGAVSSIFLGSYTVLSTILQSMDYRRLAIRYLLVGIVVKAITQYPLVALFHAHGALLATLLAFLVASVLMFFELNRRLHFNYRRFVNDTLAILIVTALMLVLTSLWNMALNRIFGVTGRGLTFVKIVIDMIIAVGIYALGMGLLGKLGLILGDRHQDLQDKLKVFQ